MKTGLAQRLALLSGLAVTLALASDSLPPNDIPLRCVAICAPVVELTAGCSANYGRLKKRGGGVGSSSPAKLPRGDNRARHMLLEVDGVAEREFSVIVAAPTTFPVQAEASTDGQLDLRPTTTATRIVPVVVQASSSASDSLLSASTSASPSTSTSTVTTYITFTNSAATQSSLSDDSESTALTTAKTATTTTTSTAASTPTSTSTSTWNLHDGIQEPQGQLYTQDSSEQDCVCLNESFDVAKVTALCASCVEQAGFPDNNVDVIVDTCNFTALTYTPSQDSAAENVRVKASEPSSGSSRAQSSKVSGIVLVGMMVLGLVDAMW